MNIAVNTLDAGQYTLDEIHKYEAIYGRNFVSPGGEATTRTLLKLVALQPDMLVLDVGCGLGGAAFVLASSFGVRVHGIDLSRNMLQLAQERYQQAQQIYAIPSLSPLNMPTCWTMIALLAMILSTAAMSFCTFMTKLVCCPP